MTRDEAITIMQVYKEKLEHRIAKIDYDAGAIDLYSIQVDAYDMAIEALSADAVEVVRCKDCYHAEDDITHMFCVYFHHKVYEDDYCSNAVERREESEAEE